MISRYEAFMDGQALSAIDPSVYVLDIQTGDAKRSIRTSKVAGRPGSRVVKKESDSTSVTILFEIHEYDTAKRQDVCRRVQKWANGVILTVSDRPEQQLRSVCESFPKANAKNWTEAVSMTFVGYNPPYWEEKNPTTVPVTSSSDAYVPGNAPESLVSCVATVTSSISSLTLTVGSKSIVLSGIGAVANDKIYIGYDENNILYIKKNTTSILDKRTGASADDLVAKCGSLNTFAVSTGATAVFTTRGCWY